MDDMRMFEQQLGRGLDQLAGSRRPVDAMSISRQAIASTRTPTRDLDALFGVTRFLVAGAIVALCGGLLLAGILTQPGEEPPVMGASAPTSDGPTASVSVTPSPEFMVAPGDLVRTDILAGVDLHVERLQRGMFRVVGDGVRDLTGLPYWIVMHGDDGGVWLGDDELTLRLGDEGSRSGGPWVDPQPPRSTWRDLGSWADVAFEGGGTTWLVGSASKRKGEQAVLSRDAAAERLMRFDGKRGRECSLKGMPGGFHPVGVDASGGLWGVYPVHETEAPVRLGGAILVRNVAPARFDCEAWDAAFPPVGVMALPSRHVSFADDGSVWLLGVPEDVFVSALTLPIADQMSPDAFPADLYVITPKAYTSDETRAAGGNDP